MKRLLFLDIDGVLHDVASIEFEHIGPALHFSGPRLFSRRHLLEELLARCPALQVVVSSSWQHHYPLEELRLFLGHAGARIIGTTVGAGADPTATRYEQCRVAAEVLGASRWVMVDDQPSIVWGSHVPTREEMARVVICDPVLGLTPMIVDTLARKLS